LPPSSRRSAPARRSALTRKGARQAKVAGYQRRRYCYFEHERDPSGDDNQDSDTMGIIGWDGRAWLVTIPICYLDNSDPRKVAPQFSVRVATEAEIAEIYHRRRR
jgi:hypothetical protein